MTNIFRGSKECVCDGGGGGREGEGEKKRDSSGFGLAREASRGPKCQAEREGATFY